VSNPATRKLGESEINLMFFSPMAAESYWGYTFLFS
jgi:hypothetical protein